jgi:hypothetical protein
MIPQMALSPLNSANILAAKFIYYRFNIFFPLQGLYRRLELLAPVFIIFKQIEARTGRRK